MSSRLLLAVAIMTANAQAESALPSGLVYPAPAAWTRTVDPSTQLVTLIAPGGNAGATFLASREFTGTLEEWLAETWKSIGAEMKLLTPPQAGRQGGFLTLMGVFEHPNGTRPWLCLYAGVGGGRGEAVVFFAGDEAPFTTHLGTVNQMVQGTAIASGAPAGASVAAPSPAAAPAPNREAAPATPSVAPASPEGRAAEADTAADIAGLYLASTRQYILNPLGSAGSGSWELRTEFYLLARDGRVFRGRDLPSVPGGDINRFDFAAARREAPGNYGTWATRGSEVILRLGEGPETIAATRPEAGTLEIRGTRFKRSVPAGK